MGDKITALPEATTAAAADQLVIEQGGTTKRIGNDTLFSAANSEWQGWTMLTAPLTSTAWDGDAYSTTAKTVIDLSVVFSVPAGVKAVLVLTNIRDSGSTGTYSYLILSPNNTAGSGFITKADRAVDDAYSPDSHIVPCDASGDIYYQIAASGAGMMDVIIQIWGYLL